MGSINWVRVVGCPAAAEDDGLPPSALIPATYPRTAFQPPTMPRCVPSMRRNDILHEIAAAFSSWSEEYKM
jgi:hypothetical protein